MVILKRNGGEDIAFTGKVRADFMRPSREIVRPVIEKTTVAKPQLRLVVNRRVEETVVAPPESSQPESPKKSAASFR
jgi:hypothetical protein